MTVPAAWEERMKEVNLALVIDLALANDNVVAVDLYPDFLGHADRANVGELSELHRRKMVPRSRTY